MPIHYYLVCMFIFSSCTLSDTVIPDTTNTGSTNQTGKVLTGELEYQDPLTENLSGSGGGYNLIFQGLETKIIPIKHMQGIGTKVTFINSEAKSMHVVVGFPGSATGNLRLSQIVMPDGNMDGPFGTDATIDLTQFGGYELFFHENMMSGDPWSGDAIVTITLDE